MNMTPEQEAECRAAWGKRSWPIAFIDWRAGFAAGLAARERETDRLRAALLQIQRWDCLSPEPRTDIFGDAKWLRDVVDTALADKPAPINSPAESASATGVDS